MPAVRSTAVRRRRPGRRLVRLFALLALLTCGLAACTSSGSTQPPTSGPGASASRPNIVFVLADDLSWNLVPYMPHVLALEHRGMTFTNYTVTDSLCCPSRASILTGEFPHDTHVHGNTAPLGGFTRFYRVGDEHHTFATSLSAAGYDTALFGKYLNGYRPAPPGFGDGSPAYVPPGWTTWGGADEGGYHGYDYTMSLDSKVQEFGTAPQDYVTTVLQGLGLQDATDAMNAGRPFLLELATFAPHKPYVPAPQDVGTFAGLTAPRPPSYNRLPTDPPRWMRGFTPMTPGEQLKVDRGFARRVASVQAIDRMVGALEQLLASRGELTKTVFMFSSDNGFHMGEHILRPGKQTAFDTDIRVPLIVAGPHIPPNTVNRAVVENIDLAPTFEQLAGAAPNLHVDGRSIVPLLHGGHPAWRTLALVEHTYDPTRAGDPDAQQPDEGLPPTYDALRSPSFTFVRYRKDGSEEYYNRRKDPNELHNVIGSLPRARVTQLTSWLNALTSCHGAASCWRAGRPTVAGG